MSDKTGRTAVDQYWEADSSANFLRRLGRSAEELGDSKGGRRCPDIWELDNGDFVIIGRDLSLAYEQRLPTGVSVGHDERLVVIPRSMLIAAKGDILDA